MVFVTFVRDFYYSVCLPAVSCLKLNQVEAPLTCSHTFIPKGKPDPLKPQKDKTYFSQFNFHWTATQNSWTGQALKWDGYGFSSPVVLHSFHRNESRNICCLPVSNAFSQCGRQHTLNTVKILSTKVYCPLSSFCMLQTSFSFMHICKLVGLEQHCQYRMKSESCTISALR